MKKSIRLALLDFPGPANKDAILWLLRQVYDVVEDDVAPDYIIFSVFGYQHLRYPNAIKIFFTGENVHADFNLCDYAFGFDWMTLEDRYFRCPIFALYDEFKRLSVSPASAVGDFAESLGREKFCNFIYSNAKAHPYRDELFRAISKYNTVDSAGPHLNNTGFTPEKFAQLRASRAAGPRLNNTGFTRGNPCLGVSGNRTNSLTKVVSGSPSP